MRRHLPAGTVTFLFTDIERSTRLLRELGDAYVQALAEHRRVLREAFAKHRGIEVDTQGDAFFVAFAEAQDALAAAREAQEELEDGPVRVRIGLHSGEPSVTEEGYVGLEVHRAARIAAAGHGGQVLVSQSTRDLVGGNGLRDLGEHRLKDFAEPIPIFQLGEETFPPLKTISNTNLPRPASSFVGREREVKEVRARLRDGARLLTLIGPGGSGKTRLAIEAAGELVSEFKAGVFWVGLAPVRDPGLVLDTIAQTLGAQDGLAEHIGERELLLLLDNLEQVVEAAPVLASLVEACANLRLLVTSRELLRVRGEVEYPVPPLLEPDAVKLFCARALTGPDEAVHELCRALDNLPLALELAAARTKVLSPRQILDRLSERLDLLKGGRDAEPRQQTLRATIEWSHDLLGVEEQQLFARLSVFNGGCRLEAAQEVAGADLDTLQSLVEKSLLRHTNERFWMLETIREFALERLERASGRDETQRRLTEFLTELARAANLNIESEGPMRHDLVIPERDNIRAALEWTLSAGKVELGLRLAIALENFWMTSDPMEGERWFDALLLQAPEGDPWLHAFALRCLGNSAAITGERERAVQLYEQSLSEFRAAGDDLRAAIMLHRVAGQLAVHEPRRARLLSEESRDYFRRAGFAKGEAQSYSLLAALERDAGALEVALELYQRSLVLCRETGFSWWETNVLVSSALLSFELQRPAEGGRRAAEALEVARRMDDRSGIVYALALLSRAAAERRDADLAGRLWGAIEAEDERSPLPGWQKNRDELAVPVFAARGPAFDAALAEGRMLSLHEAVAFAGRATPSLLKQTRA